MDPSAVDHTDITRPVRHAHIVYMIGTHRHERDFGTIMTPAAEQNLEEYLHHVDATPLE
jgi:hypothetical protein